MKDQLPALIVDDDDVNRLLASSLLANLGFAVHTAGDGEDAVEFCRRKAPCVVLMDLMMPRMGGLEASRQLLALQRSGAIETFPIVAMTSEDSPAARQACHEAGMKAFIAKPIARDPMRQALQRAGIPIG